MTSLVNDLPIPTVLTRLVVGPDHMLDTEPFSPDETKVSTGATITVEAMTAAVQREIDSGRRFALVRVVGLPLSARPEIFRVAEKLVEHGRARAGLFFRVLLPGLAGSTGDVALAIGAHREIVGVGRR